MPVELVAALSLILALIGVVGIVVPVLPGSITVAAGLLLWAIFGGSPHGWLVFGIGVAFLAAGMSAQYLITGRNLKRREIPNRSVVVGLVLGVIGMFVIPVVGLVVGFVVGLFLTEFARVRDARTALSTSWTAIRSVGIGMALELACALLATATLVVGVWVTLVR